MLAGNSIILILKIHNEAVGSADFLDFVELLVTTASLLV